MTVNHSNQNNRKNRNSKNNRQNGQRIQRTENEDQKVRRVPMRYQIRNSKETETVELKYTDIDGSVDKTKFHIYKNGSDDVFLEQIKQFQNYIDTYEIWGDDNAAHTN